MRHQTIERYSLVLPSTTWVVEADGETIVLVISHTNGDRVEALLKPADAGHLKSFFATLHADETGRGKIP